MTDTRLKREFFDRDTVQVAQELLGKRLVFGPFAGLITETEAYVGQDDPACHAARGKTARNAVMFERAGLSYVYMIYGMYHCLNIVTENEGFPAAVLIRGLCLEKDEPGLHLDGPGKLCRHLGITREDSGVDLVTAEDFYLEDAPLIASFDATSRIGIKQGTNKLWRFVVT